MVIQGVDQVAKLAEEKLQGLAVCTEITSDYVRFYACVHTFDRATEIAERLTEETGVVVSVVY